MRILLIEDDKNLAETLKERLEENFIVELAFTGTDGEYQAQINEYDLIILDILLPDGSGIEVCGQIRAGGVKTPILMLTGQFELNKKLASFDSGADDFLAKPFHFEELLARIRAIFRRQSDFKSNILSIGELTYDLSKQLVKRKETIIALRRKELHLLEYLMRNVGRVVTREMILNHVWDSETEALTNIVDVHMKYLRDKIDKPFRKRMIKTVHGLGYKLEGI